MGVRGLLEPELLEDLADVGLDRLRAEVQGRGDPLLDRPSAMSASTSRSRSVRSVSADRSRGRRSSGRRSSGRGRTRPPRSDARASVSTATSETRSLRRYPAPLGSLLEQPPRVARLDVAATARARRSPGGRSRICSAATSPSSVRVGGIRMSTITTSGRVASTIRRSLDGIRGRAATSTPASVSSRPGPRAASSRRRRSRRAWDLRSHRHGAVGRYWCRASIEGHDAVLELSIESGSCHPRPPRRPDGRRRPVPTQMRAEPGRPMASAATRYAVPHAGRESSRRDPHGDRDGRRLGRTRSHRASPSSARLAG